MNRPIMKVAGADCRAVGTLGSAYSVWRHAVRENWKSSLCL